MGKCTPIIPRIRAILSDGDWRSRSYLAVALGRDYGLNPADISALDRMKKADELEIRWTTPMPPVGHWEYRLTPLGLKKFSEESRERI